MGAVFGSKSRSRPRRGQDFQKSRFCKKEGSRDDLETIWASKRLQHGTPKRQKTQSTKTIKANTQKRAKKNRDHPPTPPSRTPRAVGVLVRVHIIVGRIIITRTRTRTTTSPLLFIVIIITRTRTRTTTRTPTGPSSSLKC